MSSELLALLSAGALAGVTVTVAVYVAAQRHRLRVIERRVAAAKAQLVGLGVVPVEVQEEVLLVTLAAVGSTCSTTLRPHYLAARQALRASPGCLVSIHDLWTGRDESALDAWLPTQERLSWTRSVTLTTKVVRRVPVSPAD